MFFSNIVYDDIVRITRHKLQR